MTDFYGCLLESQIGTTTVTVDPQCNSLDFDGMDDYITMGDHYESENSFSIETWIKPHSLDGTRTILSKNKADNLNEGGYDLSLEDDGHVVFRINGHKITYRQNKINTDRWYHLAGVYDGTQAILYIDGIQVASGTMPGPIPTPAPFLIGAMHNNSTPWAPDHFFHGWIEEVRIWNGSISEEQIRFLINQRLREGANIGTQIPIPAPGLSYTDLAGYYRLIATDILPGGYAEDLALDATYGRFRNMETLQQNTAPLPYTTAENGNWTDQNSTWMHADVWDIPNAKG